MRSGIIGFIVGALVVFLGFAAFQFVVIRDAAPDLQYKFIDYVFGDTKFPWGFLDQGRVVKRCLFPVNVTTTFYDAHYNVVTEAAKPGRYGAVVRIALNGGVVQYRFITLYRTPTKVSWSDGPTPTVITAKLPPNLGIDPAVLQKQGVEIGASINNDFLGDGNVSPDLAVILAGLSETPPSDPVAVWRTSVESRDADWWFGLRQRLGLVAPYPHLVDLPQGYDADPGKRWPLIVYLHSGLQFGHNLRMVRESGLAGLIAQGKQLPAVVVSPQSPAGDAWNQRIVGLLIDDVCAKYRIDPDRIYLTGISAGGDEAFDFATAHPERIAAIAPIAGEGDPADAARLKDVPVWDFQGMKDDVNPPENPIADVQAVRLAGGHAHQTLYPDAGHYDSWGLAYRTEALYTWLLAQKRGQPEVLTPGVPTP